MEAINYKEMYNTTKSIMTYKIKKIKELSLYNFINDTKPYFILDYRFFFTNEDEKIENKEQDSIRSEVIRKAEFDINYKSINLKNMNTRLIIITNDDESEKIETNQNYELLRTFITLNLNNISKIYSIEETDYLDFKSFYPFFFVNSNSPYNDILLSKTHFPLCLLDGILFCGNFMNSKNLKQLKALGIKSIIGLTEPDDSLKNEFKEGIVSYFTVREDLKGEIEFSEIVKQFNLEVDEDCYPVLVYCFSGKTLSIAACIAILMKYKKLNLMAATAILMKVIPDYNLPTWLYSQLQRWKY
jgi:hypothetical protein